MVPVRVQSIHSCYSSVDRVFVFEATSDEMLLTAPRLGAFVRTQGSFFCPRDDQHLASRLDGAQLPGVVQQRGR